MSELLFGGLQAILDDPDSDADRLMYADALWEIGQEDRADLIRIQVQIAQLQKQEEQLMGKLVELVGMKQFAPGRIDWGKLFVEEFGFMPPDDGWRHVWSRGFVHSVTCWAVHWIKHGDMLLESQPVDTIELTSVPLYSYEELNAKLCIVQLDGDSEPVGFEHPRPSLEQICRKRWPRVRNWKLP